jgi:hypothetical protein
MAAPAIIFFPHRRNRDGSFDSICITCFATIASAESDAELAVCDKKHICDPSVLSDQANFRRHMQAELLRKSAQTKIDPRLLPKNRMSSPQAI